MADLYNGRAKVVHLMTLAEAVQMQKDGTLATDIAAHYGVSVNQVHHWFAYLDYDQLAYHIGTIAELLASGVGFYDALLQCGIRPSGTIRERARELLSDRGVSYSRMGARDTHNTYRDRRPHCQSCSILLEPNEHDLCEVCRGVRNGGS